MSLGFATYSALSSWSVFAGQAMRKYGVDMTGLDKAYDKECVEFFSLSSLWRELSGHQVVADPVTVKGENKNGFCCKSAAEAFLR